MGSVVSEHLQLECVEGADRVHAQEPQPPRLVADPDADGGVAGHHTDDCEECPWVGAVEVFDLGVGLLRSCQHEIKRDLKT